MATTSKGTPYVEAADLVSGYPTVSLNLAEHIDDNVAYNAATINAQTGTTYTFALADATEGKLVTATNAASQTYTVPPESSVTWPAGSILRILNQGAGVVTVAAGSGVTINGTPLTLAQYKGAAIQKTGTNTWTFIPFSGGVGSAVISSPAATGSYSSGGTTYNYYTFTASGTVTVDTAGFADVLVVGGGGGAGSTAFGGGGGGGAGGYGNYTNQYLAAGTYTVTVGAGGAAGSKTPGSDSRLDVLVGVGGGGSGTGGNDASENRAKGEKGGSGGGAGYLSSGTYIGGPGTLTQGNSGASIQNGGGGGSGGASTTTAGGVGTTNTITNSSVTYATGGSTTTTAAGTANEGGGGSATAGNTAAGGSGVVIVRVIV